MDHGTHTTTGSSGLDLVALLVRLALLLATALVAGAGLSGSRAVRLVVGLGAVSAVLAVVSAFSFGVNPVAAGIHLILVLVVAILLTRRVPAARWAAVALLVLVVVETSLGRSGVEFAADTVYVAGATAWFGLVLAPERSSRFNALTLTLGLLLTVAGAVQVLVSGVAFDRRLYETGYGVSLLAVVVVPIVALVLRSRRVGAVGVAIAFLAWTTFTALPRPADLPVPGVPLLASASLAGHDIPVLLAPQRPGRNLVHLPASAGEGVTVAGVPATPRPGAEGLWADVDLPSGRSDLAIGRGDQAATIEVDTGTEGGRAVSPECESAALGGLVAGRKVVLSRCPEDALSEQDADALRKLVGFLAGRNPAAITLVSDDTPRGVAAADVVRKAAAADNLTVQSDPAAQGALVVVSGWPGAYDALTRANRAQRDAPAYTYGIYVAPWLLTGSIVNTVSASIVPLRFDPREQLAMGYAVALSGAFDGENPTVDGFSNWLGPAGQGGAGKVKLFASAQVNAMPMIPGQPQAPGMPMIGEGAGHWIPDGTVVPVSNPLE
jgi:hypothetical protein